MVYYIDVRTKILRKGVITMTLNEISKMTYSIAVGHYINGIKRTSANDITKCLEHWLCGDDDSYIASIPLEDGRWLCKFIRHGDYYDLYIPDTRDQEKRLIESLC